MSDSDLQLKAVFDKKLVSARGHSVRHLIVDVTAPERSALTKVTEKLPLNIALVIDASGSMAGAPLDCAKKAAIGVANALSANSRLSVVSFASEVETHLSGLSLDSKGRQRATDAIEQLVPRDSTNLGAGWLRGSECLAQVMEKEPGMHNHCIVLSDGHANLGITDAIVLGHHAEQLRKRGILASAVGIGDNYSSEQLQCLADNGGGQLHDAQFPHEIIEVVLGGLQDVQDTVFHNIGLRISCPEGARIECLSGFSTKISRAQVVSQLGMLAPGRNRNAIFRIYVPDGMEDDQLSFDISCEWTDVGMLEPVSGEPIHAELTFASDEANRMQMCSSSLGLRVAECWQAIVVRKSVSLNRQQHLKELGRYLENELKYFSRYCRGLQGADRLVRELETLRARAHRVWNERTRKSMDHTTYLQTQTYSDYRSMTRGPWTESLDSL